MLSIEDFHYSSLLFIMIIIIIKSLKSIFSVCCQHIVQQRHFSFDHIDYWNGNSTSENGHRTNQNGMRKFSEEPSFLLQSPTMKCSEVMWFIFHIPSFITTITTIIHSFIHLSAWSVALCCWLGRTSFAFLFGVQNWCKS